MSTIDWGKVKFRASSWGSLLAEPQSKEDRLAGKLGVTCQKELIKIYNLLKYGRKKEVITAAMEKGKICQPEAIKLFSELEGEQYNENNEELSNEYFTGKPDMFTGTLIQAARNVSELKCSWELDSYTSKIIEKVDSGYEAQMNVYFDLCGADIGYLVYALMDCPDSILEGERYRLLRSMDVISEDSPEYKKAEAELIKNCKFPDIPPTERIIKIPIKRNEDLIQKMKNKVPILRQWLFDFEKIHMNMYPKYTTLAV